MARNRITKEDREIREPELTPSFIIWSWMMSALKLSGVDIMLFAYIYSQSFDNTHYTTASLTTMANWFGLTRQTIVKHMDNLPFVEKMVSQQHSNGFYTFNYYRVRMNELTKFMINADNYVYNEFLNDYETVLKAGFPNDKDTIQNYFRAFKDWHGGMGEDVVNAFKAVIKLGNELRYITKDYENVAFVNALEVVLQEANNSEGWVDILNNVVVSESTSDSSISSNEHINQSDNSDSHSLDREEPLDTTTTKRRGRPNKINPTSFLNNRRKAKSTGLVRFADGRKPNNKESINEHIQNLKDIATNFVINDGNNNSELLELLHSYVQAWGDKGITYDSFKATLSLLRNASMSIDDMLMLCRRAVSKNTKVLVDTSNKLVQQNMAKKSLLNSCTVIIDDYVKREGENNQELKDVLIQYVSGILLAKNKLTDAGQLHQHLDVLTECCNKLEDKINSVKRSYMNGWNAMAYENAVSTSTNSSTSTNNGLEVDMEAKEQLIEDNKHKCYLYMYPQVQEALLNYIHTTVNGKSMTADKFKMNLEFLMLHRFTIDTIVAAINEATLKNYTYLCLDDYNNTKLVLKRYISLERCLEYANRVRKQDCEEAYRKNPNDERFVDMIKFVN